MTHTEEYIEPAEGWVKKQLAAIDAAGTTDAAHVHQRPVVVVTMRGARSGKLRRVPLMRVEHEGSYAAVASKGGSPQDPAWVHNLRAHPEVAVQDGTEHHPGLTVRLAEGAERAVWWERSVAAFPPYREYQEKTDRQIPVFLLEPRNRG